MREAYLLLREREKAGVEPISKVWTLFCDENFIWHELSWRILLTPRSFWLTCPLTRSWGKPGWWSTSKWWSSPTWRETLRGSTWRKLIVYGWLLNSWVIEQEALKCQQELFMQIVRAVKKLNFSDILDVIFCDLQGVGPRYLPGWRQTLGLRRGGMSSSSNAGNFVKLCSIVNSVAVMFVN